MEVRHHPEEQVFGVPDGQEQRVTPEVSHQPAYTHYDCQSVLSGCSVEPKFPEESVAISKEKIVELHPILYHMAEAGIWDSVKKHGLLSTSALLDLHEIHGKERIRIEEHRRPRGPKPCVVHGNGLDPATIRDNGPANDRKLRTCLQDGLTPRDWYKLLNGKTFFWLTVPRLITLMNAYSDRHHLVLEVDTKKLLNRHWEKIRLTPLNTGCTSPMAFPRGLQTFLPPSEYDFEANKRKKGGATKAIVELTVEYAVPDIADYVFRATHARVENNKLITEEVVFAR